MRETLQMLSFRRMVEWVRDGHRLCLALERLTDARSAMMPFTTVFSFMIPNAYSLVAKL